MTFVLWWSAWPMSLDHHDNTDNVCLPMEYDNTDNVCRPMECDNTDNVCRLMK